MTDTIGSENSRRKLIESLRTRLDPNEFAELLECLDPRLGYQSELFKHLRSRLESLQAMDRIDDPEREARREQERQELVERMRQHEEVHGSWCEPFVQRLPPPPRPDLDVDDVTDQLKFLYAGLSKSIAELQYTLAELAGTGQLDPQANMDDLQFGWCLRAYEFLYQNTICAVRREHDTCDWDWNEFDNTHSNGLPVMSRIDVEPPTADDHWEFNEHLCGDGPIREYPRNAVFHINPPPWHGDPSKPTKKKML